jgi:hypothetical protein
MLGLLLASRSLHLLLLDETFTNYLVTVDSTKAVLDFRWVNS